jgi:cystathionine beta-synthase
LTRYESITDALGGTPLIRLQRSAARLRPRVYVKVEAGNPGGSVKDRAALSMLRQAEADGLLKPGGTIVETSSGNTGIGLALYAAHLGYRAVVFTSQATSQEKRSLLAAYGAEVRLVNAFVPKAHPDSLHSVADRFVAQTPGAWLAGQYDNLANRAAHRATTGPEIWADTEGQVTHLVATVGTGGTISGTGGYLKEVSGGSVQVIGAEPGTSRYAGGDGSPKYIEGAGHFVHADAEADTWPKNLDLSVIDRFIRVPDRDAIDAVRRVARADGVLGGGSAGVALAAALTLARELTEDDTIVAILPDSGHFYLSTYYNDAWLQANGFAADPAGKTLATAAAHAIQRGVPSVPRDATVRDAIALLRPLVRASEGQPGTDAPVLVVYHRKRTQAPHPSEITGWTTLALLTQAAPDDPVSAVARPAPPKIGAGVGATDGWAQLEQQDPDWSIAVVLEDGLVTGVICRDSLQPVVAQS